MEQLLDSLSSFNLVFLIRLVLIIVIGLALTVLLSRAAEVVVRRMRLAPLAGRPARWVARWIGLVILAATLANEFGVDLYGILTAVLAMVAIGFVAVWSVMSNITCTLLLLISRPFRVLDEIEFPGEPIKGRVVDLNLFHTTLKTDGGEIIHIPNNLFFQKTIRLRPGGGSVELAEQLHSERPAA